MTFGNTRMACAFGPSSFASGTVAYSCCKAACDARRELGRLCLSLVPERLTGVPHK